MTTKQSFQKLLYDTFNIKEGKQSHSLLCFQYDVENGWIRNVIVVSNWAVFAYDGYGSLAKHAIIGKNLLVNMAVCLGGRGAYIRHFFRRFGGLTLFSVLLRDAI